MQTSFLAPINGNLKCIPFDDVLFISAKDKYSEITTTDQKKWLTRVSLSYMQIRLPENLFVRAHRTHIISLNKIDTLDYSSVEIRGYKLAVSKEGYAAIVERVLIICPELDRKLKKEFTKLTPDQYVKRVKATKKKVE